MSGASCVSAANGFIDLATFSELESFLYGGPLAISWFVAGVQKANWFTVVPIQLRHNGTFGFGQQGVSACLNRSADYVLNVWFRCQIPSLVSLAPLTATDTARWTKNLMHNLIRKCCITFNELTVQEFDNYWLDFNYMFRIDASKSTGYRNMIGDVSSMTTPFSGAITSPVNGGLRGGNFSVVLPFWFGEDTGVALPVAALPFNDVKVNYTFRNLSELIVLRGAQTIANLDAYLPEIDASTGLPSTSKVDKDIYQAQTHAHYAVIHNDERTKMGDAPRDMLIRQVQPISSSNISASATEHYFDVRLSHSIVSFFFASQNVSQLGEMSNYTTNFDYGVAASAAGAPAVQGGPSGNVHWDPIAHTQLIYENTIRLDHDSDFFSMIHPYLHSDTIPDEPGYHMWSYSVKPWDCLSPAGSTNYSKLANVQVRHTLSPVAQYYMQNDLVGLGTGKKLKISNIFVAQNWNIARVSNGSLGHPTL